MKKLALLGLTLSVFSNTFAESQVKLMENELGKYALTLTGEVEMVMKSQDNYTTPFDIPKWSWDTRAGASNREDQTMRVQGKLGLASGVPGQTEFFSYVSLKMDANDPDNMQDSNEFLTNPNGKENTVELDNAFVMWRPFEIQGGRPLGITVGKYGIKATANGAYSNIFSGDFDEDYIAYTATALTGKPMVALDFHLNADTGIGYAYVQGTSDLIKNCSGFDDEYSRTHVLWGEGKFGPVGFNAAYQFANGGRGPYNFRDGDSDDSYADYWNNDNVELTYTEGEYDEEMSLINAQVTYEAKFGSSASIMPFVGYQYIQGDEAKNLSTLQIDWNDNLSPDVRDIEASVTTLGAVYKQKIGKYNMRLSAEYSDVETPDFGGISGLGDGFLDLAVGAADIPDFASDATGATNYDARDGKFLGITGDSSQAVYTLAGLDAMYHIEAAFDLSESVTVTIFYNALISQSVDTDPTLENIEDLKDTLEDELGYTDLQASIVAAEAGLLSSQGINSTADLLTAYSAADLTALAVTFSSVGAPITTDDLAEYLADQVAADNEFGTKWSDSNSVGISVKYAF